MRRAMTAVLSLAVVIALLAACRTDGGDDPVTVPSTSKATTSLEPTADDPTANPPTANPPTANPPADDPSKDDPTHTPRAFPDSTAPQFKEAYAQRDLVFTDVRVAEHETFDRLVMEFSGTGPLGWQVNYVDEAVLEGSGDIVTVGGDAKLVIVAHYNLWPAPDYYSGPKQFKPQNGGDIDDVVVGGTFEGYTQLFAGIDGDKAPFRVFALSDPSRLVVDIADDSID